MDDRDGCVESSILFEEVPGACGDGRADPVVGWDSRRSQGAWRARIIELGQGPGPDTLPRGDLAVDRRAPSVAAGQEDEADLDAAGRGGGGRQGLSDGRSRGRE